MLHPARRSRRVWRCQRQPVETPVAGRPAQGTEPRSPAEHRWQPRRGAGAWQHGTEAGGRTGEGPLTGGVRPSCRPAQQLSCRRSHGSSSKPLRRVGSIAGSPVTLTVRVRPGQTLADFTATALLIAPGTERGGVAGDPRSCRTGCGSSCCRRSSRPARAHSALSARAFGRVVICAGGVLAYALRHCQRRRTGGHAATISVMAPRRHRAPAAVVPAAPVRRHAGAVALPSSSEVQQRQLRRTTTPGSSMLLDLARSLWRMTGAVLTPQRSFSRRSRGEASSSSPHADCDYGPGGSVSIHPVQPCPRAWSVLGRGDPGSHAEGATDHR